MTLTLFDNVLIFVEQVKKIVLWTSYFGVKGWETQQRNVFQDCPVKTCQVEVSEEQNQEDIVDADAVLFNIRDITGALSLPKYHDPNQVYDISINYDNYVYYCLYVCLCLCVCLYFVSLCV